MSTVPSMQSSVSTASAKETEMAYKQQKRADAKPPAPQNANKTPAQQQFEWTKRDSDVLEKMAAQRLPPTSAAGKAPEKSEAQKQAENERTQVNAILRTLTRYYEHPVLRPMLPKMRPLTAGCSIADAQFALDEVKAAVSIAASKGNVRTAVYAMLEQAEKVADKTGLGEAVGLPRISGWTRDVFAPTKMPDGTLFPGLADGEFSVEMAELEVLLAEWAVAPLWARALYKVYASMKAYSEGKARAEQMRAVPVRDTGRKPAPLSRPQRTVSSTTSAAEAAAAAAATDVPDIEVGPKLRL